MRARLDAVVDRVQVDGHDRRLRQPLREVDDVLRGRDDRPAVEEPRAAGVEHDGRRPVPRNGRVELRTGNRVPADVDALAAGLEDGAGDLAEGLREPGLVGVAAVGPVHLHPTEGRLPISVAGIRRCASVSRSPACAWTGMPADARNAAPSSSQVVGVQVGHDRAGEAVEHIGRPGRQIDQRVVARLGGVLDRRAGPGGVELGSTRMRWPSSRRRRSRDGAPRSRALEDSSTLTPPGTLERETT